MVLSGIKCLQVQAHQGVSHDLETGCPQLAIVNFMGVLFFKGDYNTLSQDSETGCLKLTDVKFWASNFFKGDHYKYTLILTIRKYNIFIQCSL